jgi:lysozyme
MTIEHTQAGLLSISSTGIDLIKKWESFRSKPYFCSAGVCTIGYGTTYYPSGTAVTPTDPAITEFRANELLSANLKPFEDAVHKYVKVKLTQNQFDALVSFTYNVGIKSLKDSTLLSKLNSGRYLEIPREMNKWTRANGKVLRGLVNRRKVEGELFTLTQL